jgi:hypothetical protein
METVQEQLPSGIKTYKIVNGTAYDVDTPDKVVNVLEMARRTKQRIRIFYGDRKTGKDWYEEADTMGYIGRSGGRIQIPLVIANARSHGGPHLLDNCIVKIQIGKCVQYQHPTYHQGKFTMREASDYLQGMGYTTSVFVNEENIANFKTESKAQRYIDYITGKSNRR